MAELSDFGDLRPAEKKLRATAATGEVAWIADERPDEYGKTEQNSVRAAFIRYIALGGCVECVPHEKGVQVRGAWIEGKLDLEACRIRMPLFLADSWFDGPITLLDAEARTLTLNGSRLAGADAFGASLNADRLKTSGGVFLQNGFHASGAVRLLGAEIGGDFSCIAGRFENPGGEALHADGLKTSGGVFLQNGFHASGAVRLLSADIGGVLSCIAGRFENPRGEALNADGARVRGALFMRTPPERDGEILEMFDGALDLTNTQVGFLVDAENCWPRPKGGEGQLYLGGFTYGGIKRGPVSKAPTDWEARKRWLELQPRVFLAGKDFLPQPWEQLEKVLTAQGKIRDAKKIGVAKEWRLTGTLPRLTRPFHYLHGWLAGFGYFTERAAWYGIALIILSTVLFSIAWSSGVMVPAQEVLLDDPQWLDCATRPGHAAECWIKQRPGADYVSFNSALYAFDVFIPIVTIEQESAWTPSAARGSEFLGAPLGFWFSWWRTIFEICGYILTGFIIAGAARLVRQGA